MPPATPGTLLVLAATVCLVLVSVSTPIVKQIYFLSANLSVSVANVALNGQVKLGVFGYCVEGIGSSAACLGPQVGYELDSDQIFGNTSGFSLPNSLIKWLTYALIIHPIAAGMAALSFILGVISHFREFSKARLSTWIASLASTLAMLAFIFDMVAFTIARSRLNSANVGDNANLNASLGNGIWLTLAGFVLLFLSSCAFGCGHRVLSRRPRQDEKEAMRPRLDTEYAAQARRDAQDLEKQERNRRANNGSGLPAFPEEEMPLTAIPSHVKDSEMEDGYEDESMHNTSSDRINGVGMGYGRGRNAGYHQQQQPQNNAAGVGAGASSHQQQSARRQNSAQRSHNNGHEPFVSMYDEPQPQMPPSRQGSADPYYAAAGVGEGPRRQGSASAGMPSSTAYGGYDSSPLAFPQPHGGRDAGQDYAYPTRAPSQYQPGSRNPHYISMPTPQSQSGHTNSGPTYPPTAVAPISAPPQQAAPSIPYYQQQQQQQQQRHDVYDSQESSPSGLPYTASSSPERHNTNASAGGGHWLPPVDTGGSISVPAGQSSFYNAATQATQAQQQSSRHRHIPSDTTHYQSQPNSSARNQLPQPPANTNEGRFNAHPAVLTSGAGQGISPANATVAGASPAYHDAYDGGAYDQYYETQSPQDMQHPSGGIPYNSQHQQRDDRHTPAPTYNTYETQAAPYQSYGGSHGAYR